MTVEKTHKYISRNLICVGESNRRQWKTKIHKYNCLNCNFRNP